MKSQGYSERQMQKFILCKSAGQFGAMTFFTNLKNIYK